MDHGVSASNSLQVSRRAAFEKKLSTQSIAGIQDMIKDYENELSQYKHRLMILEQTELHRLGEEAAKREELAYNHGKPLSFFKVP